MISTIWGLLTGKVKAVLGIGLTVVVIAIYGIISWQHGKIAELNIELARVDSARTMEKALYDSEVAQAYAHIDSQNEAIDQYRLDAQSYSNALAKANELIAVERAKTTEHIQLELSKDSSDTNQLKLITETLKEFSNAK